MNEKVFVSKDGLKLIVKHRKSAIILEHAEIMKGLKSFDFNYQFEFDVFSELIQYLSSIANISWENLNIREANSWGSDYFEYYDRSLDNNGYLRIGVTHQGYGLLFEKPSLKSNRLYQFNKRKIESFLYDVKNVLKEVEVQ